MLLSTKGRYGLKMIFQLALSYGKGTMSLKDIANKLDLSNTYLEQLMSQLKKAGLVNSIRGAQGGYELSREPSAITVGEIIRILEGSLAPSECVSGEETECLKADCCATRLIWEKIMVGIDNVIDGITLEDMINDYDRLNEKEKERMKMDKRRVYMDHAATTYTNKEVLAEMLPFFTEHFGNPSSVHQYGREVKKSIDAAREQVAKALGALPEEIYFTAGGSEADNWAIKGIANSYKNKGNHIITTKIEHHAVLHTCEELEKEGFEVTYLPVDEFGMVRLEDVSNAITDKTILISIMYANNEIGTIQPIPEIGKIAKSKGIYFHTDAVQAVGNVNINVKEQNIDLLSLSAHKFYGPKGIGALYIRKGIKISNLIHGGAQERRRRAGTENVPGIIGLAKAISIATENMEKHNDKLIKMRDRLINTILEKIPYTRLNGHPIKRLPGNTSFCFEFIEGESLLLSLDMKGIAGSSGSACTSGSLEPSHVLLAIGLIHEIAHGSLRLSLGEVNNEEDIDYVLEVLPEIVDRLRSMSPLYEKVKGGKQ